MSVLSSIVLLLLLCTTPATSKDGFRIGQTGERQPLQTNIRFKETRTRLRGPETASKIVDKLTYTASFKQRLTTLQSSTAGNQLLNRLAQRMQSSDGTTEQQGASEFAGLLKALESSLTIAQDESESMWVKIHATCNQAQTSATKQVAQLEGQLKLARGAQFEARRVLGKARDQLTALSTLSLVQIDEPIGEKKTTAPVAESGRTETYCAGNACVRTRTTVPSTQSSDPSDLVECFDPATKTISETTKWHSAMLETKKIKLLNRGYHTGACSGKLQGTVPASPKAKLYEVLHKLSTHLQDSNAQPALVGKTKPVGSSRAGSTPSTPSTPSTTSMKAQQQAVAEDKEATKETWKAQADGAKTDVAAASAQINSLGSVLNQEHQFKLQVQAACKDKTHTHQVEKAQRQDQLNAVQVAIELVHGNMNALSRYLQGKPPVPPAGLEPGQVVELLNPEASKLVAAQKLEAAKELKREKAEFASIFGGSVQGGGLELVQDVTGASAHNHNASASPMVECEDNLIWCETTMQCIDPENVKCVSIQVVKGLHHMDSVVQGEKSALVFHDSESEGQHLLKLKLEEERLNYEANRAQQTSQNIKDEEKMKKDLLGRKKGKHGFVHFFEKCRCSFTF